MPLPRPAPGTGKWWAIGLLGCAIGVALAVWFGLAATVGQVSWTDTGYEVIDDRTVEVRFEVHRQPGQAVTCTVRALDRGFGTVGTVEVSVPPSQRPSVSQAVLVRTTTRAVTGVVKTCAAASGAP
jgi:hypothetical protein